MAIDNLVLTRDKEVLPKLIRMHVQREESRLSYKRTMWLLSWYYLNGARRFGVFDPASNFIEAHYLDEEGNLEYQSQALLSAMDRVQARLAAMDLRPKVDRQGLSLSGIRERAIAQVMADAIVSEDQLDRVKTQFTQIFTSLGCCGISGNVIDHPVVGLTCDLEVVHPRELFPFPSLAQDYTKQRGLLRQRIVPVSFLKEVFGRRIADNLVKMEWWEQQAGMVHGRIGQGQDIGSLRYNQGYGPQMEAGRSSGPSGQQEVVGLANIRELWLDGPRGTCTRYIVTCGDYLIADEDYSDLEVYCPIGFSRFMETGTFHGAGMFELMFGISREMERLLKSLFNNIRDLDRYGFIVMPAGSWNERAVLRDVGRGLRVLPYEADPVGDGFKPFAVQPYNAGEVPGRVAQLARELMGDINPIRDLIEEKGRVDSAAGLQFLDEQITHAITNPSRGVEQAFGTMYRAAVQAAGREITKSKRALPVTKLSLDLAGAVIDQEAATVSFNSNPIPTVSQLSFTIKERSPRSEVARKAEALELWKSETSAGGLVDADQFRLFALKEGLDFAMWLDEYQEAYEAVVRNILMIYGDGDRSGQVIVTPAAAKPEFQLRVLTAFMSGPRAAMASPEVQDALSSYREFLMQAMGLVLPAAIPNPDDGMIMEGQAVDPMAPEGAQMGQTPQPQQQEMQPSPAM